MLIQHERGDLAIGERPGPEAVPGLVKVQTQQFVTSCHGWRFDRMVVRLNRFDIL